MRIGTLTSYYVSYLENVRWQGHVTLRKSAAKVFFSSTLSCRQQTAAHPCTYLAHSRLHAEDTLVGGGAQVHHAVVEPRVLADRGRGLTGSQSLFDGILAPRCAR